MYQVDMLLAGPAWQARTQAYTDGLGLGLVAGRWEDGGICGRAYSAALVVDKMQFCNGSWAMGSCGTESNGS